MKSWGDSWGDAWGSSWGAAALLPPDPPYSFTMTAGDLSFWHGYASGIGGSIDEEPIPGFPLISLMFGFTATISFTGNLMSVLEGTTVWVDGIEYPFDLEDWAYNEGDNRTEAFWDTGGNPPVFVAPNEYEIEIRLPGPDGDGVLSVEGQASVSAVGEGRSPFALSSSGQATTSWTGLSASPMALSASGLATTSLIGSYIFASALDVDGSATVDLDGAADHNGSMLSEGIGTLTSISASTKNSPFTINGQSTVSLVSDPGVSSYTIVATSSFEAGGASSWNVVLDVSGSAIFTAEGAYTISSIMTADGSSAADIVSEADVHGDLTATGSADVDIVGGSDVSGVMLSDGQATAVFGSIAASDGILSISGSATASFVSGTLVILNTGWVFPTQQANISRSTGENWLLVNGSIFAEDGADVFQNVTVGNETDWLMGDAFAFGDTLLTDMEKITGIEVRLLARTPNADFYLRELNIGKDGSTLATAKNPDDAFPVGSSFSHMTYGSIGDLWGLAWDREDFLSSSFQVRMFGQAVGDSLTRQARVDAISVRVHFEHTGIFEGDLDISGQATADFRGGSTQGDLHAGGSASSSFASDLLLVTTGLVTPTRGINVGTGGSNWTNPGNITAADGLSATSFIFDEHTNWLTGDTFDLDIQDNFQGLSGIEVTIRASATSSLDERNMQEISVYLNNSTPGTSKGPQSLTNNMEDYKFGSSTDTWGLEGVTREDLEGDEFQVRMYSVASALASVSFVVDVYSIQVYYYVGASVRTGDIDADGSTEMQAIGASTVSSAFASQGQAGGFFTGLALGSAILNVDGASTVDINIDRLGPVNIFADGTSTADFPAHPLVDTSPNFPGQATVGFAGELTFSSALDANGAANVFIEGQGDGAATLAWTSGAVVDMRAHFIPPRTSGFIIG